MRKTVARAAAAALVFSGCVRSGELPTTVLPPGPSRPALIGSDLSAVARHEALGARYRDARGDGGAVEILRDAGQSVVRLRVFVAPSGAGVEVNDLPYTIALASRARASGASLWLALHYSDTWADPGQQATPAAWRTQSAAELEPAVERYTADVLGAFARAGVLPRVVQLGNEIDGGMLWPAGRLTGGPDALASRRALGGLLRAGVRGVRQVVPSADTTAVALHLSSGGDSSATRWFFEQVAAEQVPFEIAALSYYPWWHGSLAALRGTLESLGRRVGKPMYVVETAYPWRGDWTPPASATFGTAAMPWPFTPDGQRAYVAALAATVRAVPGTVGTLWWYPEAVPTAGLSVYAGGALGLFDATGRLLPAAQVTH